MKNILHLKRTPAAFHRKSKFLKKYAVSISLSAVLAVNGCMFTAPSVFAQVSWDDVFEIQTNKKTLAAGEQFTLSLVNLTGVDAVWSSSDEDVAAVDNDGVITAMSAGSAVITVSAGDSSRRCRISVSDDTVVDGINITEPYITGNGTNVQLHIETEDGIDANNITWTSSNTQCATVDDSGLVKIVGNGANVYGTITASAVKNGVTYSDKCAVYATSNGRYLQMCSIITDDSMNTSEQLLQEKYYDNASATYKHYTYLTSTNLWSAKWHSGDDSHGYISYSSLAVRDGGGAAWAFKAPSDGIVKVTMNAGKTNKPLAQVSGFAYADVGIYLNDTQEYFCDVSELEEKYPPLISNAAGNPEGFDIAVSEGDYVYIRALMPEDEENVTQASLYPSGDEGFQFAFTSTDAEKSITVPSELAVASGETEKLEATASMPDTAISYMSSDESIATVDERGNVTVNEDLEGTAECLIYSVAEADSVAYAAATTVINAYDRGQIWLSSYSADIEVGDTHCVKTVYDNFTEGVFTYSSSDESVAVVDENGNVTAKAAGMSEIIVSDGINSRICNVYVHTKRTPGLTLSCSDIGIAKSDTYKLDVKLTDEFAGGKIVWESDDSSVASVTDGTVTGKGSGQTIVRASLESDSEIYDECSVFVGTVNTHDDFDTSDTANTQTSVLQYGYMPSGTNEWIRYPIRQNDRYRTVDGTCAATDAQIYSTLTKSASRAFCAPASGIVNITLKTANVLYTQTGETNSEVQGKGTFEIVLNGKKLKSIPVESYRMGDGTYAYATSCDGGEPGATGATSARGGVNFPELIGTMSVPVHKGDKIYMVMHCESTIGVSMANWIGFVFEYNSNESATSIVTTESDITVKSGKVYDGFKAYLVGKEISENDVEYISENPSVATVSKDGIIKGETTGETKIYALNRENKLINYVNVTVDEPEIKITASASYDKNTNKASVSVKNTKGANASLHLIAVTRTDINRPVDVYETDSVSAAPNGTKSLMIENIVADTAAAIDVYLIENDEGRDKCIYSERISLR